MGIQTDFGIDDHAEDENPACINASTQLYFNELVQFEEKVRPIAHDLVHDVLNRAVFSLEKERDLRRLSIFKQKYHSLRAEEEDKLSVAKQGYADIARQASYQESALKKVLSIRLARDMVRSLLSSTIQISCHEKLASETRLDTLRDRIIPELILDAYNVAEAMNKVVARLVTVEITPQRISL